MVQWVEEWNKEEEIEGSGWFCDVEKVEEEERMRVLIGGNDFS